MVYVLPDGGTKPAVHSPEMPCCGASCAHRGAAVHTQPWQACPAGRALEKGTFSRARDCCERCSRESFCNKECVFPRADISSCWDELGYSLCPSCCCSCQCRGGGTLDGPEQSFLCKTFYFWKGASGCSTSREEDAYCLHAGAQACSGTGAAGGC